MKKRIVLIVIILMAIVAVTMIYQTFATNDGTSSDNVYSVTLGDSTEEVVVPANSSKTIIYQITNTNKGVVQYGVAYKGENISVKIHNDSVDNIFGTIDYGENKFVRLIIENTSGIDSVATIQTILGYEKGGELILLNGYKWADNLRQLTTNGIGPFNIYANGEDLINYRIYGNSVQNGTPTADSPVEIESVGNKTGNVADLSKTVISTSTTHVKYNYDNETGTIELSSKPTAYDYSFIYIQRDVGYQFEVGKTYYFGAKITVSGKQTSNRTVVSFGLAGTGEGSTQYTFTANETRDVNLSYTYNGQENVRLIMHFNYGSVEAAQVKIENVYVSEVNGFEPVGKYKIPINVSGEQLHDGSTDIVNNYINASGVVTTDNLSSYSQLIPVTPNRTYTLRTNVTNGAVVQNKRVHAYDKDGNWIGQMFYINYAAGEVGYKEMSGITPPNCAYVRLSHIARYEEFLEFKEGYTTDIILNEPLRKSGRYVDYIDFKNKKVVRNVEVVDNTGTLTLEESLNGLVTPIEESVELPSIPTIRGITDIEVLTEVTPSNTEITYIGKEI